VSVRRDGLSSRLFRVPLPVSPPVVPADIVPADIRKVVPMNLAACHPRRRPHRRPAGRCGIVICLAALLASAGAAAPAATPAATAGHANEHGADHGHGDHHVEIGHAPPSGTSREAFESPAWFQTDLAVWSAAVFLGLLAILSKFAWKPIMEGLAKREQNIADTIAATQAANEEARQLLASYERRLAEASDEVRGMLEEARRDSEATRQTIIAEARRAAEEEQARAKREIGLATDEALSKIAERAGELAVGVAGKFLRDKLGADDQARLVRDSITSITTAPSAN
jgi:F-type H+-transporting ATPase subunit b